MNRTAVFALLLLAGLLALWLWLLTVTGSELERRRSALVARGPGAAFFWRTVEAGTGLARSNVAPGNGEDNSTTKETR